MPIDETLLGLYPALRSLPPGRLSADLAALPVLEVPAKIQLFDEGEACKGFPFVLRGQIRIARSSADGRELELYRVTPGEVCVVSTGCLFAGVPMSARGNTTETTQLLLVPRETLLGWTDSSPVREFLFALLAERMTELMALVEAIAFQRLDQRLARTLLGHGRELHATHQALANELGTAREMVSRLLKRFEEAGAIRLGRERIEILEPGTLRRLAGDAP